MLIVIPTYNRANCLRWVLQSLVQCRIEEIDEPIRVLVVNNHPPTAAVVAQLVDSFSRDRRFAWQVISRETVLMPVDNWYSAIAAYARPDEVVFLHGDDDVFCPHGLQDRYRAIRSLDGDMLLSHAASRVIFEADGDCVVADIPPASLHAVHGAAPTIVAIDQIQEWGAAFIGNHVYKHSRTWTKALALCFKWCHSQQWLDANTRTLMLPYYLPFAVALQGGKLLGLNETCVVRGGMRSELNRSRFGVPGWNSGFLALCAYDVLRNGDLGGDSRIDPARAEQRAMAAQWLPTFYFDGSISRGARRSALRSSGFSLGLHDLPLVLKGVRLLIGEVVGIRAFRLNQSFRSGKLMRAPDFLASLNAYPRALNGG